MDPDKEARIRQRAYEIWQREGQPEGRDAEHWQRAEAEIMAEAGATAEQGLDRTRESKPQSEPTASEGAPLRSRRAPAKSQRGDRPQPTPRHGRNPPGA